eukprot:COSAG03_NODE_1059_length_4930_cov_437.439661_2_plen_509_part_00
MPGAPKTLEELAEQAEIEVTDFLDFREDDFDRLTDELGINTTARVKLRKQFRAFIAKQDAVSAQDKFEAFFDRVGGAVSLEGLQTVPVSTLPVALSFISGQPGAPSKDAINVGTAAAYAKADALLAAGADPHSLTRDEIASVNMYTQDGWHGPQTSLFRPLNAALRSEARTDVKIYWGYIRLLQHALFKMPKDQSGTLFRGIKLSWPGAPTLVAFMDELVRKQTQGEEEIWWGFSSTSTSLPAVRAFLGDHGPRVIFTVDGGSSARDVRRYSHFQLGFSVPEDERLLPCGTAFLVKSADLVAENLLMVSLRQTDDVLIHGGAPAVPEPDPEPQLEPQPQPQPQPESEPEADPQPQQESDTRTRAVAASQSYLALANENVALREYVAKALTFLDFFEPMDGKTLTTEEYEKQKEFDAERHRRAREDIDMQEDEATHFEALMEQVGDAVRLALQEENKALRGQMATVLSYLNQAANPKFLEHATVSKFLEELPPWPPGDADGGNTVDFGS